VPDVMVKNPPPGTEIKKISDLKIGVTTGILRKINTVTNGTAVENLIRLIKTNF
jgi:hypothetical protein